VSTVNAAGLDESPGAQALPTRVDTAHLFQPLAPRRVYAGYVLGLLPSREQTPAETSEPMTTSTRSRLLRDRSGPHPVTPLELFFDLVYVFAATQLSHGLLEHLTWSGAFQMLLLLLAVWSAWIYTAWITNWFDPEHPTVRLVILALMLLSLVMSAALPEAFGARGLVFAAAYLTIQIGRTLFVLAALWHHELRRNFERVLFWLVVSAVPWILGATLAEGTGRMALWTLAVGIEYLSAWLGFPTPGLGRSQTSEWTISGQHLAERCQQFLLIALGESLLVTGATFSAGPFEAERTVAFVISFTTTVAMWWIAFYRTDEVTALALATSTDPGRFGRAYSYIHVIMVAGIIVTAVGDELVIAHPVGATEMAWLAAILGGPALFVAGHALLKLALFGHLPWSHAIALVALAVLAPALLHSMPLVIAASATVVLLGVAAADTLLGRAYSRSSPARSP